MNKKLVILLVGLIVFSFLMIEVSSRACLTRSLVTYTERITHDQPERNYNMSIYQNGHYQMGQKFTTSELPPNVTKQWITRIGVMLNVIPVGPNLKITLKSNLNGPTLAEKEISWEDANHSPYPDPDIWTYFEFDEPVEVNANDPEYVFIISCPDCNAETGGYSPFFYDYYDIYQDPYPDGHKFIIIPTGGVMSNYTQDMAFQIHTLFKKERIMNCGPITTNP